MTAPTETVTPVLRRTPTGWLATSPPDAVLRFAVSAPTEEEATAAYEKSYARWREIHERPEPPQ